MTTSKRTILDELLSKYMISLILILKEGELENYKDFLECLVKVFFFLDVIKKKNSERKSILLF